MKVQLFITCLGEQFFSPVLRDMVALLERLGVTCEFPPGQTCCGQPHFNSGFTHDARAMARAWLHAFGEDDMPIVAPSGSCVDMVRHHYPELFPEGTPEHALARAAAARTFEFSEFLVRRLGVVDVGASFPHRVTYHASCHYLRGLGLREEAQQLLGAVRGLEFVPLAQADTCCGFGGVFSVAFPAVSGAMLGDKVRHIIESRAEAVVACDPGCLINIGGGLRKAGAPVRAMHLIEVLAAQEGTP